MSHPYPHRRPLQKLTEASTYFAEGRYETRSKIASKDEIGQLAAAFDHMAEEIERDVHQISDDMRELKQSEVSLRKLSQVVEHSPASVFITDATGNIEYVNPSFSEITGYTRNEAVGRNPGFLALDSTVPEPCRELSHVIASGREWHGVLLSRKKNGEHYWGETHIMPLKDDQGRITHLIAMQEDITERKRAEEQLHLFNAELEQRVAERTRQLTTANKELEAFSYSVAHDLRSPLRGINGFAQLIEEGCHGCKKAAVMDHLGRIRRASARMGDLIDDLLNLVQVARTPLHRATADLSDMARYILAELAASEPARHVRYEVQDGLVVTGDPSLLNDVLANLLGNAWKFTARREDASIVFGSRMVNGETAFFVADNGAGVDMKYADRLFGVFQRLHGAKDYEGTGIGLATVQRIIHLHGGRIWAEGNIGKGATFYFVISSTSTSPMI